MNEDIVRVLRVYEFVGPRERVTEQLRKSLPDGERVIDQFHRRSRLVIRVATVGGVLGFESVEGIGTESKAEPPPNAAENHALWKLINDVLADESTPLSLADDIRERLAIIDRLYGRK